MSVQTPQRTESRVEIPEDVVDAIVAELARRDAPDELDVIDRAYEHLEQPTEFVTEDGRPLVEVALDRV